MHDADLTTLLRNGLGDAVQAPLGLAVSGGGDSMAMLELAARLPGVQLHVVTVNHGLRDGAADEAAQVARHCAALNLPHDTLLWQHDGPGGIEGNLQDQARRARYRLIAEWAAKRAIPAVAVAHTRDDLAETFLMRLSRGAGVDGLAAMSARWQSDGVTWLRPLLAAGRQELRQYLRGRGVDWAEDPSNADPAFLRVRSRAALAELGIDAETLAAVAGNLAVARDTLRQITAAAAQETVRQDPGGLVVDHAVLRAQPPEIARRLIRAALLYLTGADYAPRAGKLATFLAEVTDRRPATLYGCLALPQGGKMRLCREYDAVRDTSAEPGAVWDGMWCLTPPQGAAPAGAQIRALGPHGLPQCANWRDTSLPRAALLSSPAAWQGDRLLAAPAAGLANGWTATLAPNRASFSAFALSH